MTDIHKVYTKYNQSYVMLRALVRRIYFYWILACIEGEERAERGRMTFGYANAQYDVLLVVSGVNLYISTFFSPQT